MPYDDFKIGDRIWVAGAKPGIIAFIGETQFGAGEWAGVVLDSPDGKNDGSVNGVRYFMCEPRRGIFSKLSKLSQSPGTKPTEAAVEKFTAQSSPSKTMQTPPNGGTTTSATSDLVSSGKINSTVSPSPDRSTVSPAGSATGRSIPLPSALPRRTNTGSHSSLDQASPADSSLTDIPLTVVTAAGGDAATCPFKVGDKVVVSGSKAGTLRYVGATDFARGQWVGVELDEPLGKNDGSVAGKRFVCLN